MNRKAYRKEYYSRPKVKAKIKAYFQRPEVILHRREWFRKYSKRPDIKAYRNKWIQNYHRGKGKVKWHNYMKLYLRKKRALIKLNDLVNNL